MRSSPTRQSRASTSADRRTPRASSLRSPAGSWPRGRSSHPETADAIVAPEERNVANYLLRMNFRDLLRDKGVRAIGGGETLSWTAQDVEGSPVRLSLPKRALTAY